MLETEDDKRTQMDKDGGAVMKGFFQDSQEGSRVGAAETWLSFTFDSEVRARLPNA